MPNARTSSPDKQASSVVSRAIGRAINTTGVLSVVCLVGAVVLGTAGSTGGKPVASTLFALCMGLFGLIGLLLAATAFAALVSPSKRQPQSPNAPTNVRQPVRRALQMLYGLGIAVIGAIVLFSTPMPAWAPLTVGLIVLLSTIILGLWDRSRRTSALINR
jgi:hypothetical protein